MNNDQSRVPQEAGWGKNWVSLDGIISNSIITGRDKRIFSESHEVGNEGR